MFQILHQIFFIIWSVWYIKTAKINLREYVIFSKPRNLIPQILSILEYCLLNYFHAHVILTTVFPRAAYEITFCKSLACFHMLFDGWTIFICYLLTGLFPCFSHLLLTKPSACSLALTTSYLCFSHFHHLLLCFRLVEHKRHSKWLNTSIFFFPL